MSHAEQVALAVAAELEFDWDDYDCECFRTDVDVYDATFCMAHGPHRVRPKSAGAPAAWVEAQTFPLTVTDDDCPF